MLTTADSGCFGFVPDYFVEVAARDLRPRGLAGSDCDRRVGTTPAAGEIAIKLEPGLACEEEKKPVETSFGLMRIA